MLKIPFLTEELFYYYSCVSINKEPSPNLVESKGAGHRHDSYKRPDKRSSREALTFLLNNHFLTKSGSSHLFIYN